MTAPLPRFTVIGENIHATRVLRRGGAHIDEDPDGRTVIRFTDRDGSPRRLRIPEELQPAVEASGKVRHVTAGLLAAMSGGPDAGDGLAYLAHLVGRQVEHGAAFLDLNVDEVSVRTGEQEAAMAWLVRTVAGLSSVPVSLDSSSAQVIAAGLAALEAASGPAADRPRPLLNSASLEHLDVLDLAAEHGCAVVLGAGGAALPVDADERVANASRIVEEARARGIPLEDLYVDPLVLPVATDPQVGGAFLGAVARLRSALGPDVHITGGLSNVSYGLPLRRLLNDVFIDLAIDAGADSGIVDPVANDLARVLGQDRSGEPYRLAADALTGRDPYCMAFLAAYRGGALAEGR